MKIFNELFNELVLLIFLGSQCENYIQPSTSTTLTTSTIIPIMSHSIFDKNNFTIKSTTSHLPELNYKTVTINSTVLSKIFEVTNEMKQTTSSTTSLETTSTIAIKMENSFSHFETQYYATSTIEPKVFSKITKNNIISLVFTTPKTPYSSVMTSVSVDRTTQLSVSSTIHK